MSDVGRIGKGCGTGTVVSGIPPMGTGPIGIGTVGGGATGTGPIGIFIGPNAGIMPGGGGGGPIAANGATGGPGGRGNGGNGPNGNEGTTGVCAPFGSLGDIRGCDGGAIGGNIPGKNGGKNGVTCIGAAFAPGTELINGVPNGTGGIPAAPGIRPGNGTGKGGYCGKRNGVGGKGAGAFIVIFFKPTVIGIIALESASINILNGSI